MKNRIKLYYLLSAALLLHYTAFSQQHSADVLKNIHVKYREINAGRQTYRKVYTSPEEQYSEGGEIIGYFLKDSIRLIEEVLYAEGGKSTTAIYYDKDQPFFIIAEQYKYNVPFYDSSFNSKLTTITADRSYFHHGKMIKWVNDRQQAFTARNKVYVENEQGVLSVAQQLYDLIRTADTIKKNLPPVRKNIQ
ncbi:hypothetical protein ACTJJ0_25585 [Chitinophaga sp. 22321]|uniref:DUF4468 domain-containing protein n=1 Tax=Chitinophaga hostae TaxID=2831022 RepID=A0ABS5J5E2_9BACT|nr:hypothetical protein [Chitinophaga hostae]MBS0030440.1 hypothetical protein [Chitinophaga hostae]